MCVKIIPKIKKIENDYEHENHHLVRRLSIQFIALVIFSKQERKSYNRCMYLQCYVRSGEKEIR